MKEKEKKAQEVTDYFNKQLVKSITKMFEAQHELNCICGIKIGFILLKPNQQIHYGASISSMLEDIVENGGDKNV